MSVDFPDNELAAFSFGHNETPADLSPRELALTAILYTKMGAATAVHKTGRLPNTIGGNWNWVALNVVIRERGGTRNLTLTPDERTVHEAILHEGRLPGGAVRLIAPDSPSLLSEGPLWQLSPADRRDLVYGRDPWGGLVFMPLKEARYLVRLWHALYTATTWGELERLAPPEAYHGLRQDNIERLSDSNLGPETPFDRHTMTAVDEGDYPAWPAQEMLDWMPEDVVEEFGEPLTSVVSGDFLQLADEPKTIAQRLRAHGFTCRQDLRLVRLACGGEDTAGPRRRRPARSKEPGAR